MIVEVSAGPPGYSRSEPGRALHDIRCGANVQRIGERSNPRDDRLGKSPCRDEFKIIPPGQCFHRRMEGACSGIARQVDCNHDGIAKRYGE